MEETDIKHTLSKYCEEGHNWGNTVAPRVFQTEQIANVKAQRVEGLTGV